MTVLVVGASGNVGSRLTDLLIAHEEPVRVLVRDPDRVSNLPPTVERAVGDLDDPETLTEAASGIKKMFLMATDHGTNHTANALEAAKTAGVGHVVQFSSQGAAVDPMPSIGRYFRAREELLQESGIAWTILRCGFLMSNTLTWAESIRSEGSVKHANGGGRFAPIDSGDIAEIAAIALTNGGFVGNVYQLTGPELLTTCDDVAILSDALGRPIECIEEPVSEAAERMRQMGTPAGLVDELVELWTLTRAGVFAYTTAAARDILDRPGRDFATWARENADAFT
jgi:uncharacterized protein YbjT (DUF2867 family)